MDHKLPKVVVGRKKRIGRGLGSGKGGHTVGKGQKGQKTRANLGILFEGIKMKKSLIKKLPLQRGKGKFKFAKKPIIVKIAFLNLMPKGSKVNLDTLVKHGIVDGPDAKEYGVKILGDGEIKNKLIIEVPISKSAGIKIKKAGGEVSG